MSKKARAYIGLPIFPNLRKTFTVTDDRNLVVKGFTDELERIPLAGHSSSINRGKGLRWVMNSIIRAGDITVSGETGTRTFPNIYLVSSFKQAVDGTHPDVQPKTPVKTWHEDLTDDDLESFAVQIPKPTTCMPKLFIGRFYYHAHFYSQVKEGDWVRKGDVIGLLGHEIHAPCDGKIQFASPAEPVDKWSEKDAWPVPYNKYFVGNLNRNVLCTIIPVKGTLPERPVQIAYDEYVRAALTRLDEIRALSPNKRLTELGYKEDDKVEDLFARVALQIRLLQQCQPRFNRAGAIDISDMTLEPEKPFTPGSPAGPT